MPIEQNTLLLPAQPSLALPAGLPDTAFPIIFLSTASGISTVKIWGSATLLFNAAKTGTSRMINQISAFCSSAYPVWVFAYVGTEILPQYLRASQQFSGVASNILSNPFPAAAGEQLMLVFANLWADSNSQPPRVTGYVGYDIQGNG